MSKSISVRFQVWGRNGLEVKEKTFASEAAMDRFFNKLGDKLHTIMGYAE